MVAVNRQEKGYKQPFVLVLVASFIKILIKLLVRGLKGSNLLF